MEMICLNSFHLFSDENYCETDMVVLTNQGDIQVFSMPNLRRQLKADTIRRDNV